MVVVRSRPVDGKTAIVVFQLGELGIGLLVWLDRPYHHHMADSYLHAAKTLQPSLFWESESKSPVEHTPLASFTCLSRHERLRGWRTCLDFPFCL